MTEDAGWTDPTPDVPPLPEDAPEVQPEPEPAPELPAVDADPQEVAEEAAAAEPGPADHVPPPWLPDEGVPSWLRDAIGELHRRIQNLGG